MLSATVFQENQSLIALWYQKWGEGGVRISFYTFFYVYSWLCSSHCMCIQISTLHSGRCVLSVLAMIGTLRILVALGWPNRSTLLGPPFFIFRGTRHGSNTE